MITLRAITYEGQPIARPLETAFDEMGGTIGRADTNQLVLPDPKRHISRVHARIVFRGGGYVLLDQGSNAVVLNGTRVGNGNAAALKDGDEIAIGDYRLVATLPAESPQRVAPERGQTVIRAPAPAAPRPAPAAPAARPAPVDPLLHPLRKPGAAAGAARGVIPEDFDPFADPFAAPAPAPQPPAAAASQLPGDADFGLSLPQAPGAGSLDAMFGLGPLSGTDPLAGSALGDYQMPGPRAGQLDPLAGFGAAAAPGEAPASDRVSELHGAFTPPRPRREAAPGAASAAGARSGQPVDDPLQALFGEQVRSLPGDGGVIRGPAGEPYGAAESARGADLLRALLEGLDTPAMQIPGGMTPELARQLGRLLRESVQGTLDLLVARAMTKHEVRAEATRIAGKHNNPLKFSPDVAVALAHLLAPHGRGFMPPVAALRDAYNDLRSHQFGVIAGMQAALAGVLARFDPQALERRLSQRTMLDSLVPMNRKAKLWELFEEMYREISREAEDDFHALFGKAFLKAYDEQIRSLGGPDGGDEG